MLVSSFNFTLPDHLIATQPLTQRDASKMLVVQGDGGIQDDWIASLPSWLKSGDVLVLNDTKVMQARIFGKRGEGKVEFLLHQQVGDTSWKAFVKPAKRLKVGHEVVLDGNHQARVLEKCDDGQVLLDMRLPFAELTTYLDQHGHVPLPPYIQKHRADEEGDKSRYQTVFSDDEKKRSVAAPTAGLHFTPELLAKLAAHGVEVVHVTLHVGAGTFLPVKSEDTTTHVMHSEQWQIDAEAASTINQAKQEGRRIVAVGTTSLRTLEGGAQQGKLEAGSGSTDIFITPGYRFQMVDALLTNFHLPKSTLFMLVSAFSGLDTMQQAYQHAIRQEYRFYSYGDACLLHRKEESS